MGFDNNKGSEAPYLFPTLKRWKQQGPPEGTQTTKEKSINPFQKQDARTQ